MFDRPFSVQYHCTSRCEHRCQHCQVRSPYPGDADFGDVERNLREFANLGIPYVDFTGGNPLRCDWLPEALKLSREVGLFSSLTVSGPMITKRGEEFISLPSRLRISVDGDPSYHDRNRGVGFFEHIVNGLEMSARMRRGKSTELIFTVFPGDNGNINEQTLGFVLSLARKYQVLVSVNPVFSAEMNAEEIALLCWFGRQADVQMSKGRLRFLIRGGNNIHDPTCRAVSSVLAVTPDNQLALPCYHHRRLCLDLGSGICEVLNSDEWRDARAWQGRLPECAGCSIWCYLIPSLIVMAPSRLVAWLHALSGFQFPRDVALKMLGRLRRYDPYPSFPGRA